MGLTYYFRITAPAPTPAELLETFLRDVEKEAVALGFGPTTVLNVPFDTAARRDFSRRLGSSFYVEDSRLKNVSLPVSTQVHRHDPLEGRCAVYPEHGVVLVLTDEQKMETCFGFLKFPRQIFNIHGNPIAEPDFAEKWGFHDFLNSPDSRLREIVRHFRSANYLAEESDDFAKPATRR